jgi:hypothetical protein
MLDKTKVDAEAVTVSKGAHRSVTPKRTTFAKQKQACYTISELLLLQE